MITPYLRICGTSVAESAEAAHTVVHQAGKTWAPLLCRFMPPETLKWILQRTHHASCQQAEDADTLLAAGFQSVLITRPIVNRATLLDVPSWAKQAQLTVVIDHFRHAELLSQAMVAANASANASASVSVNVLIDVDLGRQESGVRPGPDSVLLAAAVSRLPGIQLRGVYVDDRDTDDVRDQPALPLSFEQSIGVALHCQRMILTEGISCSEIVSGLTHLREAAASPSVTAIMASPLLTNRDADSLDLPASVSAGTDTPNRRRSQRPTLELVCRVISRPSLEWCVIDAGRLSWDNANDLRVHCPSGAKLLHARPETATLLLSGESLDLRIGDEVTLTHPGLVERLHSGALQRIVWQEPGSIGQR